MCLPDGRRLYILRNSDQTTTVVVPLATSGKTHPTHPEIRFHEQLKVFALISGLFVIKVQFDIAQNLHLSQNSNFKPGPAIVTTWKGVSRDWAESWIKYHAAVGFTRLFIFWDDPKFDRETIGTVLSI